MSIEYKLIEEKWRQKWDEAKVYEVEPNEKPAMLVTAAIPYLDMPLHIGHLRTYSTADALARYKRMRGFNVLFPMGFHATGTPVLAIAKRIKNNDVQLINILRNIHHIPDDDIKKMADPYYEVDYFIKVIRQGFIDTLYSIDWRREFVSIEPIFSKMIEWQFGLLKEKGYLVTGRHPVGWCTNENNPVGQHDTKGDTHVKIDELIGIKFKDTSSDAYFVCVTYRPETIYGVTNIFINKDVKYVLAKLNDNSNISNIYLTKEAFENLKYQLNIELIKEIDASELLSKEAINPITNETVPVIPGFFVKADTGSGIVMSVPSHAPFDYVALKRLENEGYKLPSFKYIKILEIEKSEEGKGIGRSIQDQKNVATNEDIPALTYLEIMGIDEKSSEDALELATKAVYSEEAHYGIIIIGEYKGKREPEVRELLKKDLLMSNKAISIYSIMNDGPVYCRCGTKVIIKVVDDQWFINYGDKKWKSKTKEVFNNTVKLYPEKYRHTYNSLLDWIDLRAAERSQGLGTKFPLNPNHVIESLSDSTIYPMLYTFIHILRAENVAPESLKPEFFNYVVYEKGDIEEVAKTSSMNLSTIKKCRESFDYWYKNTSRHSGSDLLANHLLMYLYNHVAIFPEAYMPKQIVANGLVYLEGVKMSKSLGNVDPVSDGIKKYHADPLRMVETTIADIDSNLEVKLDEVISGIYLRNEFLYNLINDLYKFNGKELTHIDYWLYSRLNSKIKAATEYMEKMNFKNAYSEIYFNSFNELNIYLERNGRNSIVIRDYIEAITLMIAPVMPSFAEELWQMLGHSSFVVKEKWPSFDESMINEKIDEAENIIIHTIDDINSIITLTSKIDANKNKKPSSIKIIIADDWKLKAYNKLIEVKNINEVVKELGLEGEKAKFLAQFMPKIKSLIKMHEIESAYMQSAFISAQDYLKSKFNVDIIIEMESTSKSARAQRALPNKPSIEVIWQ
ncbi:MAG: leucine--tRNA ligase [Candidatus Marsarchaeota archaeon]|nr:leucine--tRNA ligase [Candidatus Marsarchaeota archaeon]